VEIMGLCLKKNLPSVKNANNKCTSEVSEVTGVGETVAVVLNVKHTDTKHIKKKF
jgi:hypothetical protein